MSYTLTESADLVSASSQYFSAADSASLSVTGSITLECWVKFTSLPSSGNGAVFIAKSITDGDQRSYIFGFDNGFYFGSNLLFSLTFTDGTNGAGVRAYTAWTPSTGTWYHVAMSQNSSGNGAVTYYIDGVAQTTTYTQQNGGSIYDGTSLLHLGSDPRTSGAPVNYLDGRLSLARVWSTNRSGTDIADNVCTVYGTATTNLEAEWSLDNVLTDASGNSNTLTNVNSATFGADVPAICTTSPVTSNFFFIM